MVVEVAVRVAAARAVEERIEVRVEGVLVAAPPTSLGARYRRRPDGRSC